MAALQFAFRALGVAPQGFSSPTWARGEEFLFKGNELLPDLYVWARAICFQGCKNGKPLLKCLHLLRFDLLTWKGWIFQC